MFTYKNDIINDRYLKRRKNRVVIMFELIKIRYNF